MDSRSAKSGGVSHYCIYKHCLSRDPSFKPQETIKYFRVPKDDTSLPNDGATVSDQEHSYGGPHDDYIASILIAEVESALEDPNVISEPMSEGGAPASGETTSLLCQKLQKRAFKCSVCEFYAKTRFSLDRHRAEHKQNVADSPTVIDNISAEKGETENESEHLLSQSVTFKCDACTFFSTTRFGLARHQAQHKRDGKKSASLKENLVKELKSSNSRDLTRPKLFKCTYCCFTSKIRFALKRHLLTHLETFETKLTTSEVSLNLKCHVCPYQTMSKKGLLIHLVKAHKENNLRCARCQKPVPVQMKNDHLLKCMKNYQELGNSKSAPTKASVKGQACTKINEEYCCDYCSFTTISQLNLDSHLYLHAVYSGSTIYKSTKKNLKEDVVSKVKLKATVKENQSKSNILNCQFCSYTSKVEYIMNKHTQLHTIYNRAILSCPKCYYRSTQSNMFKHSLDVHGVKFQEPERGCSFCSFTSLNPYILARHIELHTAHNKPILSCRKCDYRSTRYNVSKHSLKVHGVKFVQLLIESVKPNLTV